MIKRNEVAAYFHKHMADDSRFGYTQGSGRWGSGPVEEWSHDGVTGRFEIGDRDCSSSVIDCWREALRGSAYEGALDGATYTGNMRGVFVGSGLFDWHPMGDGYVAQTGDVYLNETKHTAMCQSAVPDMLTEALLNEHGGITGGAVGDQTGREFLYRGYYDFPWDGVLAYTHKADEGDDWNMTKDEMRELAKMIAEEQAAFAFGADKKADFDAYGAEKKNGGLSRNDYNTTRMIIACLNDIRAKLDTLIKK